MPSWFRERFRRFRLRGGRRRVRRERLAQAAEVGDPAALTALSVLLTDHPGDDALLDLLWEHAIGRDSMLVPLLIDHGRPAPGRWATASLLMLGAEDHVHLDDPGVRRDVVRLAWSLDGDTSVTTHARRLLHTTNHQALRTDAVTAAFDDPKWCADCVAHGLLPTDLGDRAAFFVLAGATDQFHAADPDGALLTAAYAAHPDRRPALRAALAALGEFDLLRTLAGRDDGLGTDDVAGVTAALATDRRWPDLWTWSHRLPLVEAVEAARAIRMWRPPDPADEALFDLLRRADPATVRGSVGSGDGGELRRLAAEMRADLAASGAHDETLAQLFDGPVAVAGDDAAGRVRLDRPPLACALSPDGTRIAVVDQHSLTDHRLVDGTVVFGHRDPLPPSQPRVLHLGTSVLVARRARGVGPALLAYSAQGRAVVHDSPVAALVRAGTGFVVGHPDGTFTAHPRAEEPLVGAPRTGWDAHDLADRVDLDTLTVSPGGDRLALAGRDLVVLRADGDRLVVSDLRLGRCQDVVFVDDDTLMTLHRTGYGENHPPVGMWTIAGDTLEETAHTRAPNIRANIGTGGPGVALAASLLRFDRERRTHRSHTSGGMLPVVDAEPLGRDPSFGRHVPAGAGAPFALPQHPRFLELLGRGGLLGAWRDRVDGPLVLHAAADETALEVLWPIDRLVTRTPEETGRAPLAWLAPLAEASPRGADEPPGVVELLRARLEHRYGADFAVDTAAGPDAGGTEFHLGSQ